MTSSAVSSPSPPEAGSVFKTVKELSTDSNQYIAIELYPPKGMETQIIKDIEKKARHSEVMKESKISKKQWQEMSEEEKANLRKLAAEAVRKASKEGSKIEKFIISSHLLIGHRFFGKK